jgi:predicted PilT family ATPase
MLPSIIDTIIFIEGGDILSVLVIKMTVKVPSGFRDKDLARPVVEVRDYKTHQLEFEVYSFGQDIVINPIRPKKTKYKPDQNRGFQSYRKSKYKEQRIDLKFEVTKDKVVLKASPQYASENILIFADQDEIFTGSLSRKSEINLSLSNKEGRRILKEIDRNKDIYAKIK